MTLLVLYGNDQRYVLAEGEPNPLEDWDGQPGPVSFKVKSGEVVSLALGGVPVTVLTKSPSAAPRRMR